MVNLELLSYVMVLSRTAARCPFLLVTVAETWRSKSKPCVDLIDLKRRGAQPQCYEANRANLPKPVKLSHVCAQRPYLTLLATKPREALVRLLTSDHPLGVEVGRRQSPPVPPHRRICRFCRKRNALETELHALLDCEDDRLVALREEHLLDAMMALLSGVREMYERRPSAAFLDYLLGTERLLPILAQYVYEVFALVETVPFLYVASDTAPASFDE